MERAVGGGAARLRTSNEESIPRSLPSLDPPAILTVRHAPGPLSSARRLPSRNRMLLTPGTHLSRAARLARRAVARWIEDGALQWGAAIAFYSIISLGPLVVLGLTALEGIFGDDDAERRILEQVDLLIGPQAVEVTETLLESTGGLDALSAGAFLSGVLLLVGATAVFVNLQRALNRIWEVQPARGMVQNLVRSRVAAFSMVLLLGGLVLTSMLLGALLGWIAPLVPALDRSLILLRLTDAATSLLLLWIFVSASFWLLPDVRISWRDVRLGALFTAVLLLLGRVGISAFLARHAFASAYGTAGSIFLMLLWIYYSAHVFLLGAEFTQVWALEQGRPIEPEPYAERVRQVTVRVEPDPSDGASPRDAGVP